jgi:purine-binding chemotaxis protein CheW
LPALAELAAHLKTDAAPEAEYVVELPSAEDLAATLGAAALPQDEVPEELPALAELAADLETDAAPEAEYVVELPSAEDLAATLEALALPEDEATDAAPALAELAATHEADTAPEADSLVELPSAEELAATLEAVALPEDEVPDEAPALAELAATQESEPEHLQALLAKLPSAVELAALWKASALPEPAAPLQLAASPAAEAEPVEAAEEDGVGDEPVPAPGPRLHEVLARLDASLAGRDDLAYARQVAQAAPWLRFVVCTAGGARLALPLERVVEAGLTPRRSDVPRTAAYIRGAVALRGEILPLVDLARLAGGVNDAAAESRMIVVRGGGDDPLVALEVDALLGAARILAEDIRPVVRPDGGVRLTGEVMFRDVPAGILDVDHLLAAL